jgi:exopolysaccharide biosynthesis polyprenyl glycosylphosphotransferase
VSEQRRDERRTAVDAEAEEYTSAEPVGGVESIVEARAPGHERGTKDRHARRTLVRRALIVADVWALGFTFAIVHMILGTSAKQGFTSGQELILFLLSVPCWLALAGLYGLYEGDRLRADTTTLDDFWPLFHAVTVGVWLTFVVSRLTNHVHASERRLILFWFLALAILPLGRVIMRVFIRSRVAFVQRTLIVGAGLVGQEIARKIQRNPSYGLELAGFVDNDPLPLHPELADIPVLGTTDDLSVIVRDYGIEHVMLAFTGDGHDAGLDVVRACNDLDVELDIVPRLFEVVGSKAQFHSLQGTPLLGLSPPVLSTSHRIAKRAIDILGATFGLIVLSPLLAVVAISIRLNSKGPVLFRQERIGRGQQPFTILKFRTMVADAEDRKSEVAHLNAHLSTDARMFKIPEDPRITSVGRVLRRYSIDELPQLWNVLRGQMSLVGPRPLIPHEHQYVNDWGLRRLDLTPGLTGLWQVFGRSEIPFAEMLVLDYLYVTNWTLWGDIKLVARTIPALMGRTRGAA